MSPLRVAAIMAVAMSFIPAGDTAGKLLQQTASASPIYVGWTRFFFGALMLAPFLGARDLPRALLDWRIWLRALFITFAIVSILTCLRTEDLGTAFGALFVGPIVSFALSVWLLKERVTLGRTALVLIGFLGVILVTKPGFGLTVGLGFGLLAGILYGCYLASGRWLRDAAPPGTLLLSQLVIGAAILAPVGATQIPAVSGPVVALTLASAAASMLGNLILLYMSRRVEASRLAPMVYFQLLAATGLGLAVFGDLPDGLALLGLVLLAGSGFGSALLKDR